MIFPGVVLSNLCLLPAWSVSSEFLFSGCFVPSLLCNQMSVTLAVCSYLRMSHLESTKGSGGGSCLSKDTGLEVATVLGGSSLALLPWGPFVWGCSAPPEKNPSISCLRWGVRSQSGSRVAWGSGFLPSSVEKGIPLERKPHVELKGQVGTSIAPAPGGWGKRNAWAQEFDTTPVTQWDLIS
jgi:hypothetical protein